MCVARLTLIVCGLLVGLEVRTARASACYAGRSQAPSSSQAVANGASATEDIRDIHGPIAGSGRGHAWWYVGGASALLAAAGFAIYARRRSAPLPPHERALKALAELQASPAHDARLFSFAASEIVRVYVEEAFHVRAAHRTTEELLADLMMDTSPVASHRVAVGEFLRHCDLAKFGGWTLSRGDMVALLASAETLVRATTPTPPRNHVRRAAVRGEGVA